ncbi:DAK2 domain-containing protein [Neorhizobium sp. NCHU2750]|uniref:DAK2 domain-containing protein n=1 Tax=Neorhizobium sp. NCHU2750 TaxID=1825976 RepID=UPI0013C3E9AE
MTIHSETIIATADIQAFIHQLAISSIEIEDEVNAADRALGDGDTGTMLVRFFRALDGPHDDNGSVANLFYAYAIAAGETTGSSLGTLLCGALMAMSQILQPRETRLPLSAISGLAAVATHALLELGGARLGDKTIADTLDAIATATKAEADKEAIKKAIVLATRQALDDFSGKPCRIGRARMWSQDSKWLADPGMFAAAELCARTLT